MSDSIARRECEALARALPHELELKDLKAREYCGRTHRVAYFDCKEAGDLVQFVLVPGGEVSLGFDGNDFNPSDSQIESFADSAKEYDLGPSIRQFVDAQTSPRRSACVPPMLIEVVAREVMPLEPVPEHDAIFARLRDQYPQSGTVEYRGGSLGEDSIVVKRDNDGAVQVSRRPATTLVIVDERLRKSGMRLPTCDEWEHACGTGATTLFRWGDDTPVDFYPTDTCAEDRALKTAWALSGGKLVYEAPPAKWDLHQRPNLFGLKIANNPYQSDLVADGPRALGGDGGCNICGGAGFFLGWLPLATAFRNPYEIRIESGRNVADDYHRVRRAISID
jgi:hypothetical protein